MAATAAFHVPAFLSLSLYVLLILERERECSSHETQHANGEHPELAVVSHQSAKRVVSHQSAKRVVSHQVTNRPSVRSSVQQGQAVQCTPLRPAPRPPRQEAHTSSKSLLYNTQAPTHRAGQAGRDAASPLYHTQSPAATVPLCPVTTQSPCTLTQGQAAKKTQRAHAAWRRRRAPETRHLRAC